MPASGKLSAFDLAYQQASISDLSSRMSRILPAHQFTWFADSFIATLQAIYGKYYFYNTNRTVIVNALFRMKSDSDFIGNALLFLMSNCVLSQIL